MIKTVHPSPRLEGTVVPAGDKSISHRAVLLNTLAEGTAHVSNFCVGDDRASMLRCLRGLGAHITNHPSCPVSNSKECFLVEGKGLGGFDEPSTVLNAGNSGTTMRLVSGLLAAQPFLSIITGDQSLRARDMSRIVAPLKDMGAQIMGRRNDSLAPLAFRGGKLRAIDYTLPVASAQVKSAILIAGLYADGETTVRQPAESRDHTERTLRYMNANLRVDGLDITVQPSNLTPRSIRVPGDISSAAFWMVAGCAHPNARIRIEGVGINPTRTGVIRVLQSMGGRINLENAREDGAEPVADIVVESSDLVGTEIRGDIIPQVIDELPVLAVAASFASGHTVIADARELRVKESDRIAATVEGLSALGANIEERPDGMVVQSGARLIGGECRSHDDHRIAMTLGIAGLMASGKTVIDGAEAADVSYPDFWETLESLSSPQ